MPGSDIPAQNASRRRATSRPGGGSGSGTRLELGPGVVPQRLAVRAQLERLVALAEVLLAGNGALQVRWHDLVRDEPIRVEALERRLVAVELGEVVVAVLLVEHEVDEVVRENRVLR